MTRWFVLILVPLFALLGRVEAAEPLLLSPQASGIWARGHAAILRDPTGELTIDDAMAMARDGRFRDIPGNLGLGYTPDAVWLRVGLVRERDAPERWLVEVGPSYLDDLRIFLVGAGGLLRQTRGGDLQPFSTREHGYRNALVSMDVPVGRSVLFIRIASSSTMIAMPRLWRSDDFAEARDLEYLLLGLYYGALLTVTLLNLISFGINRQSIYLTYSGYVSVIGVHLFAVDGLLAQFILPDDPLSANRLLGASLGIGSALGFRFYAQILRVPGRFPWSDRIIWGIAALGVATGLSAFSPYYPLFAPFLLLSMVLSVVVFLRPLAALVGAGDAEGTLVVVAYAFYAGLLLLTVGAVLGLIEPTRMTLLGSQVGSVVHFALLHSSIFLRAHRARREKLAAEAAAEQALIESAVEREMRIEREGLLDMLSHEILTPMAVIDAANQSLQVLDEQPSPEREKRYRRIERAVGRLRAMLDLALNRARSDAGNDHAGRFAADGGDIARDIAKLLSPDSESRLAIRVAAGVGKIPMDEKLIRFALLNLVDNALKYSPRESPVTIGVGPLVAEGRAGLCWSVENRGRRITPGFDDRLFRKYVRGGEESGEPGLGLGLYLTRHIFEQHGGWVRLDDSFEAGVRFTAWLPEGSDGSHSIKDTS